MKYVLPILLICGTLQAQEFGDCNNDKRINISDVIYLVNLLFIEGGQPHCSKACDVNNDKRLNIADAILLAHYLFLGAEIEKHSECNPVFIRRGDANADGRIDDLDFFHINEYLWGFSNSINCKASADTNQDGVITDADIMLMLQIRDGLQKEPKGWGECLPYLHFLPCDRPCLIIDN